VVKYGGLVEPHEVAVAWEHEHDFRRLFLISHRFLWPYQGNLSEKGKNRMPRTRPWEVSDQMWEKVQPLIPPAPSHAKGGRPRMDDRRAFEAIIYVLSTGIQWNALPRELGASTTVYDRFQEWEKAGFFRALWQAGLYDDDEVRGIEWEWQSVDGAMRHQPLSGKARSVPTHTASAKSRVKRRRFPDGTRYSQSRVTGR